MCFMHQVLVPESVQLLTFVQVPEALVRRNARSRARLSRHLTDKFTIAPSCTAPTELSAASEYHGFFTSVIVKHCLGMVLFILLAVSFAYISQHRCLPGYPLVEIVLLHQAAVPVSAQVLPFCHDPVTLVRRIAVSRARLSVQWAWTATPVPSATEPPELSETWEYVGNVISLTVKQCVLRGMVLFKLPAVSFAHSFQQMCFPALPTVEIVLLHQLVVPVSVQELICHEPDAFCLKRAVSSATLSVQETEAETVAPSATEPPELSAPCEYHGFFTSVTVKHCLGMVLFIWPAVSFAYISQQTCFPASPAVERVSLHQEVLPMSAQVPTPCHDPEAL